MPMAGRFRVAVLRAKRQFRKVVGRTNRAERTVPVTKNIVVVAGTSTIGLAIAMNTRFRRRAAVIATAQGTEPARITITTCF